MLETLILFLAMLLSAPAQAVTPAHWYNFQNNLNDTIRVEPLDLVQSSPFVADIAYSMTPAEYGRSLKMTTTTANLTYSTWIGTTITPFVGAGGAVAFDYLVPTYYNSIPNFIDCWTGSSADGNRVLIAPSVGQNVFTRWGAAGFHTFALAPGQGRQYSFIFSVSGTHVLFYKREIPLATTWTLIEDWNSGVSINLNASGIFHLSLDNGTGAVFSNIQIYTSAISSIDAFQYHGKYVMWYGNSLFTFTAGSGSTCPVLTGNGMNYGAANISGNFGTAYSARGSHLNAADSTNWSNYQEGVTGISSTTGTGVGAGSVSATFASQFPISTSNTVLVVLLGTNDDYPPYGPLPQTTTAANYLNFMTLFNSEHPGSPAFFVGDIGNNCSTVGSAPCLTQAVTRNATIQGQVTTTAAALNAPFYYIPVTAAELAESLCSDNLHYPDAMFIRRSNVIVDYIMHKLDPYWTTRRWFLDTF